MTDRSAGKSRGMPAKPHLMLTAGAIAAGMLFSPAKAQSVPAEDVATLRTEIARLRAEQAERMAEMQANASRIDSLAERLDRLEGKPAPTPAPYPAAPTPSSAATAVAATTPPSRLQLNGDLRLRYESNFGDDDARSRDRGVLRARLRATFKAADWITLGGQIATGDPDDPNSSDISLSNFDDNLQVSLDQAYARLDFGQLQIFSGKMPQPFVRTDMVWDSDVSPQGVSANYKLPLGKLGALKATGLYFLIDEAVAGPDSRMIGGQLSLDTALSSQVRLELAGGYYDYSLRSMAGGDAGDFRSNRLRPDGRYLSDFNLVNLLGAVTFQGLGDHWPIRLSADYVHNLGAATAADTGYQLDLLVGRGTKPGDWRFGYGYGSVDTDAVLAAFSQDNTTIATNYLQHSFTLDYVLRPNLILNATYYHYRPKAAVDAGANDPRDWLDRLRLNFLVNF